MRMGRGRRGWGEDRLRRGEEDERRRGCVREEVIVKGEGRGHRKEGR
jgi:hypothetical protein